VKGILPNPVEEQNFLTPPWCLKMDNPTGLQVDLAY